MTSPLQVFGTRPVRSGPVATGIAVVALNIAVLTPAPPLRAAIGLPLALLAPGYALLCLALGRGAPRDIPVTMALSVLLSMAIYPLLALMLSVVGLTLSPLRLLEATDVLCCALAVAALARSVSSAPRAPSRRRALVPAMVNVRSQITPVARRACLHGALVCSLIVLALTAPHGASLPDTPFTQFYLVRYRAYPNGARLGGSRRVAEVWVAVENHSHRSQTYRLTALAEGMAGWTSRMITLRNGAVWSGLMKGQVPAQGCAPRLQLLPVDTATARTRARLTLWVQPAPFASHQCGTTGSARAGKP